MQGPDMPGELSACRACGAPNPAAVLDLGLQPEGRYLTPGEAPAGRWPLRAFVCESCWLVQSGNAPAEPSPPGTAPWEHSATMRDHARAFVDQVIQDLEVGPDEARVIDLASHGGYLNRFLRERGMDSLVVESSGELVADAASGGARVLHARLDPAVAASIVAETGTAHVVNDNYLLAHVVDPNELVAGIAAVLGPAGRLLLEFDHVLPTLAGGQWDSFRLGHFSFFSLLALEPLLARHGLAVIDASEHEVYGGAVRITVMHATEARRPAPSVRDILDRERAAGLDRLETYRAFGDRVAHNRADLLGFLHDQQAAGRVVAAYGAPSRATTLLNYAGATIELIAFAADASPAKQGRLIPGTGIPVVSPQHLLEAQPDFVLILTWDIADEIRRAMAAVEEWGGRFVLPLPEVRVVEPAARVA